MPTQPYFVAGKRVPSVTTILGKFKDCGGLMHWSWSTSYDVLAEAVDILSDANKIRDSGVISSFLKSKPLERGNYRSEQKSACEAGSIAHELASRWISSIAKINPPSTVEPQNASDAIQRWTDKFFGAISQRSVMIEFQCTSEVGSSAYKGISGFGNWVRQNRFSLYRTEVPLLSREHRFGGTLDCIGKLEITPGTQELILFDWKTSNAVYADYLCQIAAYNILWEENNPTEPIHSSRLLRFDKTTGDFTEHSFRDLTEPKRLFLLFREAYDLVQSIQKRI